LNRNGSEGGSIKSNHYTITVENPEGDKITLTVFQFSNIFDWSEIFAVILTWVGFGVKTIRDILTRENDE